MKKIFLTIGFALPALLAAADQPLKVAVFPFDSEAKEEVGLQKIVGQMVDKVRGEDKKPVLLGDKIAELLTADLSQNPAVALVERAKIEKAYEELSLGKTGLTDETTAAKLGHLVGAQVLVTGKAFPLDDELFVVAKVIGVETGRVFASKANGPLSGKLKPIVDRLGDEVNKVLLKNDAAFTTSSAAAPDPLDAIAKALGTKKRPTVAVYVKEEHLKQDAVDPTVETELMYLLKKSGFKVLDEKNRPLADWAKAYLEGDTEERRPGTIADVIVVGEAFSEFGARRGELISCKARVELRALSAKTGEILAIERRAGTGVDIAEQSAARAALQEATRQIAPAFVSRFVSEWAGQ